MSFVPKKAAKENKVIKVAQKSAEKKNTQGFQTTSKKGKNSLPWAGNKKNRKFRKKNSSPKKPKKGPLPFRGSWPNSQWKTIYKSNQKQHPAPEKKSSN